MMTLVLPPDTYSDAGAFIERLYYTYRRLIYSQVRKYVKDSWDADDVVQSVLMKLIEKEPFIRTLNRDETANYIYVTARNNALNYLRDRKNSMLFSFDEAIDGAAEQLSQPDHALEQLELQTDIHSAWRALDERERVLLEMKYYLDKSDAEIAEALGVKPNSVRMLLTRARKRMKRYLQDPDA